jgi:hypothetical protein
VTQSSGLVYPAPQQPPPYLPTQLPAFPAPANGLAPFNPQVIPCRSILHPEGLISLADPAFQKLYLGIQSINFKLFIQGFYSIFN